VIMHSYLSTFLLLLLTICSTVAAAAKDDACICENTTWCENIKDTRDVEIFGFYGKTNWTDNFDWSTITTIAWADSDPSLVCKAHSHGVRVIAGAPGGMPLNGSKEERQNWIDDLVKDIQSRHLDGVTFDYESPLAYDDVRVEKYVQIVNETTIALHAAIPASQVSVCVAWSPDDIDGRAYDVVALADASDLLYVMSYDTRSQIFDRCIASANSPTSRARYGLQRYIDLGIDREKLILGTPWYGYDYPCLESLDTIEQSTYCTLNLVPFRGVNCSDAAGRERPMSDIENVRANDATASKLLRDSSTDTPFFHYVNEADGTVHQIWYDDAESSKSKYDVALALGVRGVGPFTFSDLDYSNERARSQAGAMWDALGTYKKEASASRRAKH